MASSQQPGPKPAVPAGGGVTPSAPVSAASPRTDPTAGANQGLKLVLFGLPGSGKSSLLGALARVTPSPGGPVGRFLDPTGTLGVRQHHLTEGGNAATAEETKAYPTLY